jgi:hypothetical protein
MPKRGFKFSVEQRKKMSDSHIGKPYNGGGFERGNIPWNKGLTAKDDIRVKRQTDALRKINKNKKHHPETEEWRKKISDGNKGKKCPYAARNFQEYIRVHGSWNKGLKGYRSGSEHYNWKGGISKIDRLIRQIEEYKLWRAKVFERDNWTCQTCGTRGCYLEAHHLIEFHKLLTEYGVKSLIDARNCMILWDIDNGVSLCMSCHDLTKNGGN